jgi:hypothetical protein
VESPTCTAVPLGDTVPAKLSAVPDVPVVGGLVKAMEPELPEPPELAEPPTAAAAKAAMVANESGVAPGRFTGGVGANAMSIP